MSAVAYPDTLPPPSRNGFSARLAVRPRYLQMDDGGRRPMARWVRQPLEYMLVFQFGWEQLARFEAWWAYDLHMGTEKARIEVFPGVSEEVQFTGDYQTAKGDSWTVSVKAQSLMARPTIPPAAGLPVWPLPPLESDSYQYTQFGGTRTNIKDGTQTARQRFARNHADVQAMIIVDGAELTQFLNFARNDLCGSLGWFSIPLAAGRGIRNARTSLLDFEVTPLGAAYRIALTMTTFQLPRMGRLEYLYPNGLVFSESIQYGEAFGYAIGRYIMVQEILSFVEQMSRRIAFEEQMNLTEKVSKQFRMGAIQDIVTYLDSVRLSGGQNPSEQFGFVEQFNWNLLRRIAESVQYIESVSMVKGYNRQVYELLSMVEQYAVVLDANSAVSEGTMFSEDGKIRLDTYAANYFDEDYTSVVQTF